MLKKFFKSKSLDVEEDLSLDKLDRKSYIPKSTSFSKIPAFKLIFLGTSESGKTTIVKQILHHINQSSDFFKTYIPDIYDNLISGTMKCIEYAEQTNQVIDNVFTKVILYDFI